MLIPLIYFMSVYALWRTTDHGNVYDCFTSPPSRTNPHPCWELRLRRAMLPSPKSEVCRSPVVWSWANYLTLCLRFLPESGDNYSTVLMGMLWRLSHTCEVPSKSSIEALVIIPFLLYLHLPLFLLSFRIFSFYLVILLFVNGHFVFKTCAAYNSENTVSWASTMAVFPFFGIQEWLEFTPFHWTVFKKAILYFF